uniref:Roadblock/LAMTOR2 domain-containing protein n=1 Tax=Timema monikensis TaxID=170555 RepID=A0A7R9E035_9NEOP|nr:unnamed protein product [Timema monikensis]
MIMLYESQPSKRQSVTMTDIRVCLRLHHSFAVPIKTTLSDARTTHYVALLNHLTNRTRWVLKDLDPTNDLTSLRIRSKKHEIIVVPVSVRYAQCFVPREGSRGGSKTTERERSRAENGSNGERNISRVNEQLQHKDMTVDRAVNHLTGLKDALQDIRDTGIDVILNEASNICVATSLEIDCFFEEKREKTNFGRKQGICLNCDPKPHGLREKSKALTILDLDGGK